MEKHDLRHRDWIRQLYIEFDGICFQHRVKMRRPLITISNARTRYGCWDSGRRQLSIADHLIEAQPWWIVVDVLKHEMAHQYVSEVYRRQEGHGPYFKAACRLLGADAKASMTAVDLQQKNAQINDPTRERLLKKVEKLFALSASTNEYEARLAMNRAQELNIKYNLDRRRRAVIEDYHVVRIALRRKRIERHLSLVCSLLTGHFFVEVVVISSYDAQVGDSFKTIEIIGTSQNVKMAEYVYHFVCQQLTFLWKMNATATHNRRAYMIGVVSGLMDSLDDNRQGMMSGNDECALIACACDRGLKDFLNQRYPRLRTQTNRYDVGCDSSYSQGHDAGKKLRIHKPIDSTLDSSGSLLTASV